VSKLNLVGVEASAKISSYATGNADAFVTTVPGDMPHVVDKRPSNSLLFADYGMDLPSYGLLTRTDTLKTKAAAIKRFVSIISASWAYIMAGHVQEAAEATMKQRPAAANSVKNLVGEFERHAAYFVTRDGKSVYPGMQDRTYWAKAIGEMETAKVIPPGSTPEKYFTNDYIDADYGKKTVGLAK
jgi:NitT/TauT family transport system substrate-binding protein